MKIIKTDKEVIAEEEKRKDADRMNKEFYEPDLPEKEESGGWGLTPAEEMSAQISCDLAFMTADRFEEMVEDMDDDDIDIIIGRLKGAGHEAAVRMLQAMFLIRGYKDAAMALDLLRICEEHDGETYRFFMDCLFETEFFECFFTEFRLQHAYMENCLPPCLS